MFIVGIIICLFHTFTSSDAEDLYTFRQLDSVDFIQGQTAKIVWNVVSIATKPWNTISVDRNTVKKRNGNEQIIVVEPFNEPNLTKYWSSSGRNDDIDLDVKGRKNTTITITLTIRNLVKSDERYYYVMITNIPDNVDAGLYTYMRVLVLPGIPTLTLQPDKAVYCSNSVLNITLDAVVGQPNQTNFTLVENNVVIAMISGQRTGNWSKAVFTRQLSKPGTFVLSGKAMIGAYSTNSSKDITITVKDPPVITSCTNKTAFESKNLDWTCDVSGSEPLNTSWFKGNTNTFIQSGKSLNIAVLNRTVHSGWYRFTASNGEECPSANKSLYLDVNEYKYLQACSQSSYEITKGACFSVQPDGNPVPSLNCSSQRLTKFKDGDNYTICGETSSGVSTCVISNGFASCQINVTVYEKVSEFTWQGNFNCSNCTWDDTMADKNSQKFKSFKTKWENILTKVYQNKKYVNRITVVKFSPGVVVSFELMLEANVSDPLSPLKEELRRNGGAVGGFTIDSKSISSGIYAREISASTTTARPMATTKSSYLTQGAIIGIAVGCSLLVVIAIAVIVIYCCCCKKVNGVI